jgi:hypothetical protein
MGVLGTAVVAVRDLRARVAAAPAALARDGDQQDAWATRPRPPDRRVRGLDDGGETAVSFAREADPSGKRLDIGALGRLRVAIGTMIAVPVPVAFVPALLGYAARWPLSSWLVHGILAVAIATGTYLGLSLAFNRSELPGAIGRVRSLA